MNVNCEDPDSCGAVKKNAELCNDLDAKDATIAAQAKEIDAIKTDRDARKALLASVLVMFGKYIASEDRGDLLESMRAIEQALTKGGKE